MPDHTTKAQRRALEGDGFLAVLMDRNFSTRYVTPEGGLTVAWDDAEVYETAQVAELRADPIMNGIPADRVEALHIRGFACPVGFYDDSVKPDLPEGDHP